MLLTNDLKERTTIGAKETNSFKIASTRHMFEILSSRLYSDPISSIVRELYTNAMEVTTFQAPTLSAPSSFFPEFVLRDYGPGLSHDSMVNVYISAGTSTKNTSNDHIGAFGLGSKSPFAYCDSYTIISYHSGHESRYLVHKTDDGLPSLSLVYSKATTEPSGLEIRIPVKQVDTSKWVSAIQTQLRQMPILPSTSTSIIPLSRLVSHGNVHITDDNYNSYLVMGGPIYILDRNQLRSHLKVDRFSENLLVDAPIGSVDLTPSREQLNYTPKTIQYLKHTLEAFQTTISQALVDEFAKAPTYFDACLLYNNYASGSKGKVSRFQRIPKNWNGKTLDDKINLYSYEKPIQVPNPADPTQPYTRTIHLQVERFAGRNRKDTPLLNSALSTFLTSTIYIARPTDSHSQARYVTEAEKHMGTGTVPYLLNVTPDNSSLVDSLLADWQGFNFIEVSTLPPYTPPPRKSSARATLGRRTLPRLNFVSHLITVDKTTPTTTWDTGGFYLLTHFNYVETPVGRKTPYTFKSERSEFLTTFPEVYMVAPSQKKAFLKYNEKAKLWTDMNEHLSSLAAAAIASYEVIPTDQRTKFTTFLNLHDYDPTPWVPTKLKAAHAEYLTLLTTLTSARKALDDNKKQHEYIEASKTYLGLTTTTPKISTALDTTILAIDAFNTKYPTYLKYRTLLRTLGHYNDPKHNTNLQELINL